MPSATSSINSLPSRPLILAYLVTLLLLPWSWFPPFPWLHEHAQWSDVVFAITALLWAIERWRTGRGHPFDSADFAIASYFVAAVLSLIFTSGDPRAGALKVFGIGELCLLAIVTRDLASHPPVSRLIVRVTALNAFLVGAAAICGLLLFYAGLHTPLIGIYGELLPSSLYARVQAGLYNPNLLANYTIFAAAIVGQRAGGISPKLRRVSLAVLWITSILTFSRGILGFVLAAIIRNAHTRRRQVMAAGAALMGVAIMFCLTFYKVSLNPVRPYELEVHREATSRYQALITSFETFTHKPLWGSGPETHPGFYLGNPFDSHMTFMHIAATLGLPALIAFLSIYVIAWRRRSRPVNLAVWGGLAGLALDALGQDIQNFRHLWVLTGYSLAEASGKLSMEAGGEIEVSGKKAGNSSSTASER